MQTSLTGLEQDYLRTPGNNQETIGCVQNFQKSAFDYENFLKIQLRDLRKWILRKWTLYY